MNPGLSNNINNEGVRNVGYAYILFSFTFLISVIYALFDFGLLTDVSILLGFVGLIVIIVSSKSLEQNFRRHLINGVSLYILFDVIAIIGATVYIASEAISIATQYPSGNIPYGLLSSLIVNTVYITFIPLLLLYISYYILNVQFFSKSSLKFFIATLFASFALKLAGIIGEVEIITSRISSATTLSSAESILNLIEGHPVNIYSLFSILSAVILLILFFYSGKKILNNPQNYTRTKHYDDIY